MKLYFTRHGESEANVLQVISNRGLTHGLTATGRMQAEALAGKLQGKLITRIFTSPLLRARQTGEILSAALDVPLECVDGLREPDCGILEGRGDVEAWAQHRYWMEIWLAGHALDQGPNEGDTYIIARERFTRFIKKLVDENGNSQAEFVIVTHGEALLFGLPSLLANVTNQFILDRGVGHTVLITAELQDEKLVCVAWEAL